MLSSVKTSRRQFTKTSVLAFLAVITGMVGFIASAYPSTANAAASSWGTGGVTHVSDRDYNLSFKIKCENGSIHYVSEGQSSTRYCRDTAGIYVRSGQKIVCKRVISTFPQVIEWRTWLDSTGYHAIHTTAAANQCVSQAD